MIIVSVYKLRSERLAFRARTLREFRVRWNTARARWFELYIEFEMEAGDVVPKTRDFILTKFGLSKIIRTLGGLDPGVVIEYEGRSFIFCHEGAFRRLDGNFGPDASPDDSVEVRP